MQITTERLVLREFTENDWPAVLAYQTDPRYLRFYGWTGRTAYDVRDFVQRFIDQQKEQPRRKHQLAITLKANRQLIGNVGIRRKNADDWEADIGYELAPEHWGRGYATEAARAILTFGFEDLKLHRIWAWCIAENTASARVLEKIGMRLEGRLRENEWIKNRWYDSLMYAVLDHDWQASRASAIPAQRSSSC